MTEQSKTAVLTKKLLREYYELGTVAGIMELTTTDVVGFGMRSDSYAVGREQVEALLHQLQSAIGACHVTKLNANEKETVDGVVIRTNVIYADGKHLRNMQQVQFMFRRICGELKLAGLHFQRDVRHEMIYHMASAQLLNRGDIEGGSQGVMSIVSSYVSFAYVEYLLQGDLPGRYYSDELLKLLGYASRDSFELESIAGLKDLINNYDLNRREVEMARQLEMGSSFQVEYRLLRQDGSYIWCLECGHVEHSSSGADTVTSIIVNLSPLKQIHSTFLHQLRHDRLTNLYNKNAFCRRVSEVLAEHPETEFEVMRFNIARFKVINDLFGEETGDRLLKYVAEFLKNIQLESCVYGRLYADNFILFYPTKGESRQRFIHSLQLLAESFALDYRIEFYFGVYTVTDTTLSVNTMLDRATMGLAKAAHNGLVICGEYDDNMRDDIVNEQKIVNSMHASLRRGDFIVYLQPKYQLSTGRIVGAEALVRWQHPQLGFISPAKFIPIFEQNGFIYQLDKYVWEKTCELLHEHIVAGRELLPISVNVSRIDLYSPNITQVFDNLVRKYQIPTELLELELTESAYVDNPQQIIEITKELQASGFRILMDDFGSGYSSLNMLKDMPVDILKIDLKFLANTDDEAESRGSDILRSVVRMAKWLGIPVIVEGVETASQVDFLKGIGCEYGQGYYYAKPVPIEQYEEMLDKQNNG